MLFRHRFVSAIFMLFGHRFVSAILATVLASCLRSTAHIVGAAKEGTNDDNRNASRTQGPFFLPVLPADSARVGRLPLLSLVAPQRPTRSWYVSRYSLVDRRRCRR
jgi:hypothetical protein